MVRLGHEPLQVPRRDVEIRLKLDGRLEVERAHPFDERGAVNEPVVRAVRLVSGQ